MTDLREAAQQALEVLEVQAEGAEEECGEETCRDCQAWRPVWVAITALKAALEQRAQKPVAWLYPEGLEALKNGKCWTAYGTKQDAQCIPVYLNGAVAPKVEPAKAECAGFDSQPVPRREWRGLTDTERAAVQFESFKRGLSPLEFMELHEAALRSKNHE